MSWESLESPQKTRGFPAAVEWRWGLKRRSTMVLMTALLKFRVLLVPVGLDSSPIGLSIMEGHGRLGEHLRLEHPASRRMSLNGDNVFPRRFMR
jgi:hypothetical protein